MVDNAHMHLKNSSSFVTFQYVADMLPICIEDLQLCMKIYDAQRVFIGKYTVLFSIVELFINHTFNDM